MKQDTKPLSKHPMSQDAATEAYLLCRPRILKLCSSFKSRYGGELEEMLSQSHNIFIGVYMGYNARKSTLRKRMGFILWKRLLDWRRSELHRTQITRKSHLSRSQVGTNTEFDGILDAKIDARFILDNDLVIDPATPKFDVEDFAEGLSDLSRSVVQLIFETPKPLQKLIKIRGGPSGENIRIALRAYLRDAGWSIAHVVKCFKEIREALS